MPLTASSNQHKESEFNRLFTKSYGSMYHYAWRLTGNRLDAEDLAMDAYVRAWQAFESYDRRFPFHKWLSRILTNLSIDRKRRLRLKFVSLDQMCEQGDNCHTIDHNLKTDSNEVERSVMTNCLREEIERVLNSISQKYRTIIRLVDVEGLSYQEVSERLSCSEGVVRSRLYRGRRKFIEVWKSASAEEASYNTLRDNGNRSPILKLL